MLKRALEEKLAPATEARLVRVAARLADEACAALAKTDPSFAAVSAAALSDARAAGERS